MAVTDWCHPTVGNTGLAWASAGNACEDDTTTAQPSGDDSVGQWTEFKDAAETNSLLALIPTDATSIDGIEARLRAYDVFGDGGAFVLVSLSYDGGTNYTSTAHADARNPTGSTTYGAAAAQHTSGGSTSLFGRTFSRSEFSDANFIFRLTADSTDGFGEDIRLEFIELRVHYTPAGGAAEVAPLAGKLTLKGGLPTAAPFTGLSTAEPLKGLLRWRGFVPEAAGDQLIITLGVPNVVADNRITAVADLEAGDLLAVRGVGGTEVPSGLVVSTDATFYFESGSVPRSFEARAFDQDDSTWGNWALQSIAETIAPFAGKLTFKGFLARNPSTVAPFAGRLLLKGHVAPLPTPAQPTAGKLTFKSLRPTLAHVVTPSAGRVLLKGNLPVVATDVAASVTPAVGQLRLKGYAPRTSATVNAISGRWRLKGYAPSASRVVAVDAIGILRLKGFVPSTRAIQRLEPRAPVTLTYVGYVPDFSVKAPSLPSRGVFNLVAFVPTITSFGWTAVPAETDAWSAISATAGSWSAIDAQANTWTQL